MVSFEISMNMTRGEKSFSSTTEAIHQLLQTLCQENDDLSSSLASLAVHSSIKLNIEGEIYTPSDSHLMNKESAQASKIHLGSIYLPQSELQNYCRNYQAKNVSIPASRSANTESRGVFNAQNVLPSESLLATEPHISAESLQERDGHMSKRRRTTNGPWVGQPATASETDDIAGLILASPTVGSTARQLSTKSREFPQRKNKKFEVISQLQPTSLDKFIAGLWKQIYSSIELAPHSLMNLSRIILNSFNKLSRKILTSLLA